MIKSLKNKILRKLKTYFVTDSTTIVTSGIINNTVKLQNSTLSGNITINKNSEITNSTLYTDVMINENSKINNSVLWSNVSVGKNANIQSSTITCATHSKISISNNAIIQNAKLNGNITIGQNVKIIDGVHLSGKITIGKNVSLNGPGTDVISAINEVVIGNYCSIARNVAIQEFNHNFNNLSSYFIHQNVFKETKQKDIVSKGTIEIKNDVWIGTQSVILSGVTIGNGVVVAANSTVVNNVPDYAIVAGSPAKILSYRFSPEIIAELLRIKWWSWSDEKLQQNKLLFSDDLNLDILKSIN